MDEDMVVRGMAARTREAYLLEAGVDIHTIQRLLGHGHISTTTRYFQLTRHTHRVALSNDRLVDHRDGRVRFRWKDYADHDRGKVLTLAADEFLRRFLLHVVPRGFMRIRHFGLLANRTRRAMITRCRALLGQPPPEDTPPESVAVLLHRLTGVDLARCPVCGEGQMQIIAIVVHPVSPPDTS
jgi:hypothetical protein